MFTPTLKLPIAVLTLLLCASCSSNDDDNSVLSPADLSPDSDILFPDPDVLSPDADTVMSFFLTSRGPGDGGNLGGLPGADVHCANLAEAAGTTGQQWRAYLSTTGADGINARDRIGTGPWVNANGVVVADNVDNLISDDSNLTLTTALSENGEQINGIGDTPLRHDILTGTELDGNASLSDIDTTCLNWTSNDAGAATVGHHDRVGGGANPTSFSTAHPSSGCSQTDLQATGGDGLFYCFAL